MIPALVQWEFTDRCPFRCVHCYHLDDELSSLLPDLPDEDMHRIAEMLVAYKLFFGTLTGGEPLTRPKLLVEITRYLASNGIILSRKYIVMQSSISFHLRVHWNEKVP